MPQPEVDDPQRVGRGRRRRCPLSSASAIDASSSRRNSSTWRYFACLVGLIRPSASLIPSATSTGSSSASSRCLVAVVAAVGRDGLPAASRAARPRPSWSPAAGGSGRGVDVPVAEGLVEQRDHRGLGRRSPSAWLAVCACVSSYDVTCRCAPGLQVDVAQLHAAYVAALDARLPLTLRRPEPTARTSPSWSSRVSRPVPGPRPEVHRQQRRDDDDQQRPPSAERDDEAAVAGVHDLVSRSRRSRRTRSPVLHGATEDAGQVLGRDLAGSRREQPLLLSAPATRSSTSASP